MDLDLLERLDAYFDAVPRNRADPIDVGPFVLFRSREAYPFYARPRRDRVGEAATAVSPADVRELVEQCATLKLPAQVEWVVEIDPKVGPACAEAGLQIVEYPLLTVTAQTFRPAPVPSGAQIEAVGEDTDPDDVRSLLAVADVGFRAGPGDTAVGPAGVSERDTRAAATEPLAVAAAIRGVVDGSMLRALVRTNDGIVATGSIGPVDQLAEIMGVATLPAFRQHGFGAAVTSSLVSAAIERGCDLVLLSAGSEAVAHVYEQLGFERVGHTGAAAPGPGERA